MTRLSSQQLIIYKTVFGILLAGVVYLIGDIIILYKATQLWDVPGGKAGTLYVLALADPQIQGYYQEHPSIIGAITRWDSDRYLRNTFSLAMSYASPDVVVFLGDLLDEGSFATDDDFLIYKNRFHDIFSVPDNIPKIYLAGDNDIGGEGGDVLTSHNVERFSKYFGPINDVINIKNFQFVKINTVSFLRFSFPAYKEEQPTYYHTVKFLKNINLQLKEGSNVILLAHAPLPNLPSNLYHKFISSLKPKVSLAGHSHKHLQIYHRQPSSPSFWEYTIPTCSYRMGTNQIGAGVLIIDEKGKSSLHILKFPERYIYLYMYLIFCCILLLGYSLSFRATRSFLSSYFNKLRGLFCIFKIQGRSKRL
ncbi:cell division control protein 1 [Exaiptasia diaphana]|uniref:Calcineurin-like phosphoesterase domain-containing protein n=1 Tax=Exaiptasia diaphana TaxID=2652724 RepID=A0A913XAQ9_EXADI|nr:cell division control protein 1 [Exaiptasia diaphana]KXJ13872.1 Cell division control protein 1 [Exaiptasia diaphana]